MTVDLNSDLGEGFGAYRMGDDAAMLEVVTSANIACGFHAGDPSIMRRTCALAVEKGVRIGAHIGYRDLPGFGRRALAVPAAELRDETLYQIGSLDAFARAAGDRVRYVKPHGALYHAAAADRTLADAIVAALREFDSRLALLGPAATEMEHAARAAGTPSSVRASPTAPTPPTACSPPAPSPAPSCTRTKQWPRPFRSPAPAKP